MTWIILALLAVSPQDFYRNQECIGPGGAVMQGTLTMADDKKICLGTDCEWWLVYNLSGTEAELWHTSCDGAGTDCMVMSFEDGADDVCMPNDAARFLMGAACGTDVALAWDGDSFNILAAVIEMGAAASSDQTVFPISNDAGTPTLAFGDGGFGFYASSDDTIRVGLGGAAYYHFSTAAIQSNNSNSFRLAIGNTDATTPTLIPNRGDLNTGVGAVITGDKMSFIVGGVSMFLLDEDTVDTCSMGANVFFDLSTTAGITASVTQSQGQGSMTSSVNEISTVGSANDTVTMPAAAAGRLLTVINNGANLLQIFPASGDDLGPGVDVSTTLDPNTTVRYTAFDATTWADGASGIVRGEMFDTENTDAYNVTVDNELHCYHTNGMTTDASSLSGGWTQDGGGVGTSFPVASITDSAGSSGTQILVTTTGSHGLAVGDIVSITNLSAGARTAYIYQVLETAAATTFEVAETDSTDATGTMNQCAYLLAPTGGGGVYDARWNASATSATNNETFDWMIYINATSQQKTEKRRKFGTATDYGSLSGAGYITIAAGDQVVFVFKNLDSAGDTTLRYFNLGLHEL